ncbi:eukaryotic-like serine/threonine-protein kinase [Phycisphaerales bacterium]|nr:eukaryotic-like serine/threonine-protein kinase [Phycisphaerales bacterium]
MTSHTGQSGSAWFHDEGSLLGLARRVRASTRTPEIPGYDELTEIKRGGQGVVYQGTQRSTRQRVAVKVLLGGALAGGAQLRRFEREGELAASLRHPNVVRVFDSGVTGEGLAYMVMEYVEGRPLDEVLREAPAPRTSSREDQAERRRRIEIFAQVCDAVAHAHQRGVIHRDLKPSNVRIDADGRARVLDFGLAKSDAPETIEVSTSGQFLGSLPWASPEQAAGDPSSVDTRSDVYSLGVMLHQLLTGEFPYGVAGNLTTTLENIRGTQPRPIRSCSPGVDEDLQTIALKCLSKEPDRRYQSAADLTADVHAWLAGEPIRARRDSAWYTLRKTAQRHRAAAITAGVALVASLGVATWTSVLYSRATSAEAKATASLGVAERELGEKSAAVEFLRTMLTSPNPSQDGRQVKVVDVLGAARKRLDDASLAPASKAILCAAIGDTYIALGQYDLADPLMNMARDLRVQIHGEKHVESVFALVRLSYLRSRQGKLDEATDLARQAVADGESALTPKERARTRAQEALALALHFNGKLKDAETAFRAAIDDQRALGNEDTSDFAEAVSNLAVNLRQQERTDEALSLYESEIARAAGRAGKPTSTQFILKGNYASALHGKGDYERAARYYREAIAGLTDLLGEDHDDTLSAVSNLSTLLIQTGKFGDAEILLRRGAAAAARTLGPDNPTTLTFWHNLSKALHEVGKLDEAETLMRKTLDQRIKILTEEHAHTLITMSNLAALYRAMGRDEDAFKLDSRALEVRRRVLGESNSGTLISYSNVGLYLAQHGEIERGVEYIRKAVDTAAATLGPDHFWTGGFRGNLAKALDLSGKTDDAEREFLESHRVLNASLGAADKRVKASAKSIAEFYSKHQRPQDADKFGALAE